MENRTDFNIAELTRALDSAVMSGNTEQADRLAAVLFRLQGGADADTEMPEAFAMGIAMKKAAYLGGHPMKQKSFKKIIAVAAAVALLAALGITAYATQLFGLRDLVMKDSGTGSSITNPYHGPTPSDTVSPPPEALIAMQGYPDSGEYKATAEWNAFLSGYDTDHSVLNSVGNSPNEYTEKYPEYLVYSKEMADRLEELIAKYGLKLHTSMTIAESQDMLFGAAEVGNFVTREGGDGVNKFLGGYVYNDGTFQYDGQATLFTGTLIGYQFGNYVKGTFSSTYLNIGDASSYDEWQYATQSGVTVSLALGESKALVILDLPKSFVVINVLTGTAKDEMSGADTITKDDLQKFADLFDYSQLKK